MNIIEQTIKKFLKNYNINKPENIFLVAFSGVGECLLNCLKALTEKVGYSNTCCATRTDSATVCRQTSDACLLVYCRKVGDDNGPVEPVLVNIVLLSIGEHRHRYCKSLVPTA